MKNNQPIIAVALIMTLSGVYADINTTTTNETNTSVSDTNNTTQNDTNATVSDTNTTVNETNTTVSDTNTSTNKEVDTLTDIKQKFGTPAQTKEKSPYNFTGDK